MCEISPQRINRVEKVTHVVHRIGLGGACENTIDNGLTEAFAVYLDNQEHSRLDVSAKTKKGSYHFVGFSIAGENGWIRSEAAITVE